ncbi:outer membrane beta-barrel protein [Filimonas effusa]|uniref:TonB-dependent receptor n=1 Tax=Filimonas effusa TaxID=2508721 RepID=A0A4Q1DAG8_9BACT|nr:outer membrane beta-barrel protein [Filimonas effusa]RXK86387.1 TonB-dependent receptor [Filimonas effusa]
MLKQILAVALFYWCYWPLNAQVTITGKLVNNQTGNPIEMAPVRLLSCHDSSLVKTTVTDSTGMFLLSGLPSNRYLLHFSPIGYQPLYHQVMPEQAGSTVWKQDQITMTADTSLLTGVVVSGRKPAFQMQPGKLVVNIAGNKLFNTAAHTLDILKRIPGLEVTGDGSLQMSGRITPAVFIDGKPVPMGAEELQNYLATLSPDMIASIEVINNPSSQYDAVYKGIINIRLKPDKALGWKGLLTANLQRNAYTLAEPNLLLTYKTRKMAYTARWGYTSGTTIRRYEALQHLANTNIMATNTRTLTGNNNINYQLGIDYNINPSHKVELLLRNYRLNRTTGSYNALYTTDSASNKVVSNTNSDNNATLKQRNYAVNLNYTAQLGQTLWQLQSSLLSITNRQLEDIQNKNILTSQLNDYWKTASKNDISVRTAQLDVSGDLAKGKWSIGTKLVFSNTQNDLRYDTLTTANIFKPDSSRTNRFDYDENITAAYIAYERKWNKLQLAMGLRAEQTHTTANSITDSQVTKRNYINWLPSLNITYTMERNRQLQFAFTRRITRPNFAQLNPFRFYFSPLNYWVGNPYLKSSVTTLFQFTYNIRSLTFSLQAGRENDPMTRYPEYDSVTNILQYLGRNLPYNNFAGIEMSIPWSVTPWWRMSHNLGGYYKKEQTPYHNVTYAIPIYNLTITGSQVFTLPGAFTLDLYYYYNTPGGDGLYTAGAISNIDLGLQRTWLKGTLNTRLNYYDLFNMYRVKRGFREKSIINNRLSHWFGMQRLSITVSYSFGKSTYKTKQAKRNEEENRAGW